MASLPSHRVWQHISNSPPPETEMSETPRARSPSQAPSQISEDSQTVLLNTPTHDEHAQPEQPTQSPPPPPPPSRQPQDDPDVKKCWICFADETEDTATTSQWRSPCPCALVAHENCLLDWIADMESPSARKRTIAPPQILCPQCKSEIHLARPKDPLVELVRAGERVAAKVVLPTALLVGMSTIYEAFTLHGIHSVYQIFGQEDAWRILRPVLSDLRWSHNWDARQIIDHALAHWRLHLGLPLISPMLILSRTRIIDSVLPIVPIIFFATAGDSHQPLDIGNWPPSAALSLAVLPYMRGIYNAYYDRVWAPHHKRWLKEIQPRNNQIEDGGEDGNGDGDGDDGGEVVAEEEGIFEVRIDGNIWQEWDDGRDDEAQQQPAAQRERMQADAELEDIRQEMFGDRPIPDMEEGNERIAPPLHAPPLADDAPAAPAPEVPRPPPQQRQQQPPQAQQQAQPQAAAAEHRLSISTNALGEKIIGALLFPTIASLAGEALNLLLPRSWVYAGPKSVLTGMRPKATGLLQQKWGRSIVGGCLFVVFKDAVMLYVRWKMAQQHRRRKVLDYDRRKGKVAGR